MRPPFSYYGGKIGMAPTIARLLPPHRVYLEPFFGSGAVFFAKEPATHEIINDVDGNVVNFFEVLRTQREALEHECALTPHARAEFDCADLGEPDLTALERARRFWVRVNQSFNHAAGDNSGWSVTTARTQSPPASALSRIGRFAPAAERLMPVSIECCDAIGLIERLATPDAVVYADPPYLDVTRRGGRGSRASDYGIDMSSREDHERLAKALHATPAAVVLSGYHSELYDDLYGDWARTEIEVAVHASNARAVAREGRVEVLWSNREPASDAVQLAFGGDE